MTSKVVYLAAPYSHDDPDVRAMRAAKATSAAAKLAESGEFGVISPVTMGHAMALASPRVPYDFSHWKTVCTAMLLGAEELFVLCLDGWAESCGVQEEIRLAQSLGMRVRFFGLGCDGAAADPRPITDIFPEG